MKISTICTIKRLKFAQSLILHTMRNLKILLFLALFYSCTKLEIPDSTESVNPTSTRTYLSDVQYVDSLQIFTMASQENLKAAPIVPRVYSMTTFAIRDQGSLGSCTGFAGAEVVEILFYTKTNKFVRFSPLFVYYCERVLINKKVVASDGGSSVGNVPISLQRYGVCLETSYVYSGFVNSIAYKTAPSVSAMSEGLKYKVTTSGSVSIGDIESAKYLLRSKTPLVLGFNVYDNSNYSVFERMTILNYTYNPLSTNGSVLSNLKLLGMHAVVIVGYDDVKGAFICQNSFGASWGNKGFFNLPYSVFKSSSIVSSIYFCKI